MGMSVTARTNRTPLPSPVLRSRSRSLSRAAASPSFTTDNHQCRDSVAGASDISAAQPVLLELQRLLFYFDTTDLRPRWPTLRYRIQLVSCMLT